MLGNTNDVLKMQVLLNDTFYNDNNIKWGMSLKVIESHIRSLLCLKNHFFYQILFLLKLLLFVFSYD